MCRNIRPLFNFAPPATDVEIRDAALQFVRKIAGTRKPTKDNVDAFDIAVEQIFVASKQMLEKMVPHGPPKDRVTEMLKAKERSKLRFKKVG